MEADGRAGLEIVVEDAVEAEGFGHVFKQGLGVEAQVEILCAGLGFEFVGRQEAADFGDVFGGGEWNGRRGRLLRQIAGRRIFGCDAGGTTLASSAARVRTAWLRSQ